MMPFQGLFFFFPHRACEKLGLLFEVHDTNMECRILDFGLSPTASSPSPGAGCIQLPLPPSLQSTGASLTPL